MMSFSFVLVFADKRRRSNRELALSTAAVIIVSLGLFIQNSVVSVYYSNHEAIKVCLKFI